MKMEKRKRDISLHNVLIANTKCFLYVSEFFRQIFSRHAVLLWLQDKIFCYFLKIEAEVNF